MNDKMLNRIHKLGSVAITVDPRKAATCLQLSTRSNA
jgi:hypothetical protein